MAATRLCSVLDCGKPAKTKGWCKTHYSRWYARGTPTPDGTKKGELADYFNSTVITHSGDDCLFWPYGTAGKGYGLMTYNGERVYVHIAACLHAHGPKPSPLHEVAHSCGNGHLGCVSPRHLRWDTRTGNCADKLAHGTANRGAKHGNAKLTAEQVVEMRGLKGALSTSKLGAKFGVSQQTASDIVSRRRWTWL